MPHPLLQPEVIVVSVAPPVRMASPRHTHISDVFIVAIMALVVKFYSFNDALFVGTLLAMTMFTVRYSGSQAGVRTSGDARDWTEKDGGYGTHWKHLEALNKL